MNTPQTGEPVFAAPQTDIRKIGPVALAQGHVQDFPAAGKIYAELSADFFCNFPHFVRQGGREKGGAVRGELFQGLYLFFYCLFDAFCCSVYHK